MMSVLEDIMVIALEKNGLFAALSLFFIGWILYESRNREKKMWEHYKHLNATVEQMKAIEGKLENCSRDMNSMYSQQTNMLQSKIEDCSRDISKIYEHLLHRRYES